MVERAWPGQYGIIGFVTSPETLPDDIAVLQTELTAERAARQQAEARASGAEAMVAYLKLMIANMKRERFGQSGRARPQACPRPSATSSTRLPRPPAGQ